MCSRQCLSCSAAPSPHQLSLIRSMSPFPATQQKCVAGFAHLLNCEKLPAPLSPPRDQTALIAYCWAVLKVAIVTIKSKGNLNFCPSQREKEIEKLPDWRISFQGSWGLLGVPNWTCWGNVGFCFSFILPLFFWGTSALQQSEKVVGPSLPNSSPGSLMSTIRTRHLKLQFGLQTPAELWLNLLLTSLQHRRGENDSGRRLLHSLAISETAKLGKRFEPNTFEVGRWEKNDPLLKKLMKSYSLNIFFFLELSRLINHTFQSLSVITAISVSLDDTYFQPIHEGQLNDTLAADKASRLGCLKLLMWNCVCHSSALMKLKFFSEWATFRVAAGGSRGKNVHWKSESLENFEQIRNWLHDTYTVYIWKEYLLSI